MVGFTTMPPPTISTLSYITREQLASTLLSVPSTAAPAIIDVRDSDHIGGHIRGSTWVPSSQHDYKMPELLRTLKDKDVVVFHCALSQQRGPAAALRYLREKEARQGGVKEKGEEIGQAQKDGQKVYVLKGGFTEWQEMYGKDARLTEGYQKDVWEFGN